jgi:hypothetical protein
MAYFAERAGLGERSCKSLVAALEEFCLDSLPAIQGSAGPLDVAIQDFEDRIQIIVEHPNPQGMTSGARSTKPIHPEALPERRALHRLAQVVDRVERDSRNGSTRTTLVKFL